MIKEAIVKLAAKQNLDYETAEVVDGRNHGRKGKSGTDECIFNRDGDEGRDNRGNYRVCGGDEKELCTPAYMIMDVLEIVGTGGDHSNSFNISTTSSLVIAAGRRSGGKTRQPCCIQQDAVRRMFWKHLV